MKVSIGICAYNEEANIGKLLARLQDCSFDIIVIASGCTDNTIPIVKKFKKVKLLEQKNREGKASAVNQFIAEAKGNILVLVGGDIIPSIMCFKHLLEPFEDNSIGMVGAHPIPVDNTRKLSGKMAHLLWDLHHYSALAHPKAGEVCAFRNIVKGINPKTPVDEASIEQQIVEQGYKVVYAPKAIVFNKGTGNITDFIKQRKRIYHGHLALRDNGYAVPTMSYYNLLQTVAKASGKHYRTLVIMSALEAYSRYKASQSYKSNGYNPAIWEMVKTTKELQ